MAEDSAPWEGTTIGDAASTDVWSAPYSDDEWADIDSKLEQSNVAKGYVIPGYGNSLRVHANSPAALNVLVETGAIRIRGRLYELTAQSTQTVTAADATNPRIDRVVARITFASQTIRLAVLAGTPAATPSLPTLTQNATTYEISLAYIWVAALAASVAETEIHDERVFASNFEGLLTALLQDNLIKNSEFLLSIVSRIQPPAAWSLVSTPSALAGATKPSAMARGNYLQITADGASEGISQSFNIKASTVYAIRLLINVTAGDVGVVTVTDNGASPATITRNIRRTGSDLEEFILYTTPSDATTITISLLANASTDIVKFGQVLALEGYQTGPFRQINPDASQVLLDEIELTADGASFDFQNIPTGFKNLIILGVLRSSVASNIESLLVRLNNDSSANYYSIKAGIIHSATLSTAEVLGGTSANLLTVAGNTSPANAFDAVRIEFPDYLEATNYHEMLSDGALYTGLTTGLPHRQLGQGTLRVAGAITRITILPSTGPNWMAGSRLSLYGLN